MFKRLLPLSIISAVTFTATPAFACSPVWAQWDIESMFAGGATQSQVWESLEDKYYFENTTVCKLQYKGFFRQYGALFPYSYQAFYGGELPSNIPTVRGVLPPLGHTPNVTPGGHTMRGHTGLYGAPGTIYHGPRGGRFTVSPNGSRNYIN